MDELIRALKEQTEAINRLAASNEEIVALLVANLEQPEGDEEPTGYLSGKARG